MNNNTNIIPQIETEFLATVRDHMSDRNKAASLFTWASEAISNGAHGKDVVSLIAELINENFALSVQLNGRANSK